MDALTEFAKFSAAASSIKRRKFAEEILYFVDVNHTERMRKSGALKARLEMFELWETGTKFLDHIFRQKNLVDGNLNRTEDVARLLGWLKKELPGVQQVKKALEAEAKGNVRSGLDVFVFELTEALKNLGHKQEACLVAIDAALSKVFLTGLREVGGYKNTLGLYKGGKKKTRQGKGRNHIE